ncbi:MAG: 23S rRNA (uridine(2552)-2'-O)-methyltransferase RlmE [Cellvibrionaceae bacterium]|nr:23S rRNA (uridine(2552)-2'-O)-methyltransferase RlmE [Cellvibrionaceae bacterium]
MPRSKTSKAWLQEHVNDPYVKQAQEDGYRSRACYKLLELQRKDAVFRPGMTVIDLGAAPGGWSQIAVDLVGDQGKVIASDILPMDTLAGVEFVQGDFTEESVLQAILAIVGNHPVDLVISDMAPNMSGMAAIDQPRALYLVELAFALAAQVLVPGGGCIAKVFQGEGCESLMRELRPYYRRLISRKPEASRARSREVYWVATGFKGPRVAA